MIIDARMQVNQHPSAGYLSYVDGEGREGRYTYYVYKFSSRFEFNVGHSNLKIMKEAKNN